MQFGLVLATLLCFTTWMNLVHAVTGPVQNCPCLRWSPTQIHVDKILNYTIQREGICSITAIMFQTVRGKTICSDPETKWTKKAMQKVDSKAKPKVVEKIQKEEGSASEMTPAVSSAPTKSPQRTSRIVKRLKKRSRKMRQWQRSRACDTECVLREHLKAKVIILMMQFGLVLATFLCFTTWMNLVHAATGPVQNCQCLQWSTTKIHTDKILNYTIQREGTCSVTAIIFQTVGGKTLCSNPDSSWTKKAMLKVDRQEARSSANQEVGSLS
ncbi:uncharacterized protein LOC142399525 [Odontesthes bonariensis]|uniref:uncharacterized protein LOC142399525 n=1 Tax=Odontesthes bonariensis TaxID=219752 RepID=UPI003F58F588